MITLKFVLELIYKAQWMVKKIFLFNQFIKNSCHHFIKGSIKNKYPTVSSYIFDKLINSKRNVFNITKESVILIGRTSETMQLKSINN